MQKFKNCFITGTDTDIGKTYTSVGLLKALAKKNYKTLGLKPISAGCVQQQGELRNVDALALQQAATINLPYKLVNPFAFSPPIAPHIAAVEVGVSLSVDAIVDSLQPALAMPSDINIIEGAGGWLVPLNQYQQFSDLAVKLDSAVVLVVGIKLGCLNHSLLSARAIEQSGLPFIGWVANYIDPEMDENERQANIATLESWLNVPCLGKIPFAEPAAAHLNVDLFLQRLANTGIA